MNTLIGNRSPYNILHVVFASFYPTILFLKGSQWKYRGFTFEGIRRWPVINLVTFIHGYSYLVSLEIVVGYKKLRSFQGTQVNLSLLLEKPDITCHGTLNTESL